MKKIITILITLLQVVKIQVGQLRHLTRNGISLLLLFASWPVCLVHRFWNNAPPYPVNWFPFDDKVQDVQWYLYDTGNMLSVSLILLSFIVRKKKNPDYSIGLVTIFTISIIDIVHYWLWFKQNELLVLVESLIMILASLIIIMRNTQWKKV